MGAGWGITQPLAKIAVSTGHLPLGILFWQFVIGVLVLGGILALKGQWPQPSRARFRVWLVIALIGTLLPGSASYIAIGVLPSGIVSILLATVPMMAYPVALAWGLERFAPIRLLGLVFGLVGVALITLPEASLPDRSLLIFIPLAMVAPAFYACEGPVVARWGTAGMSPVEVLFGASCIGIILTLPLAVMSNQWIDPTLGIGLAEWALIASSVIHAMVYAGYVWLVKNAGAVFAVQTGYFVTIFGVIWAMMILGERFAPTVWLAMLVMLAGVALVQPRPGRAIAQTDQSTQDRP